LNASLPPDNNGSRTENAEPWPSWLSPLSVPLLLLVIPLRIANPRPFNLIARATLSARPETIEYPRKIFIRDAESRVTNSNGCLFFFDIDL